MPGYSELILNFEKIRDFVRDFFIFGYRSRNDYSHVSSRSYDNERRRIQSYLGEYIVENRESKGKSIAVSSDTTAKTVNPLFKVWQTKSFTRNDCFLHFVLLDILQDGCCFSTPQITEIIANEYMARFPEEANIDAMTIRNKLNEYVELGILQTEKKGKTICYSRVTYDCCNLDGLKEAIQFYQNILPAGFLGSSLVRGQISPFIYRQIFFAQALDDEILMQVLAAISQKRSIRIAQALKGRNGITKPVVPVCVLANTRTGRRYLAYYTLSKKKYSTLRVDYLTSVEPGDTIDEYDQICREYNERLVYAWSIVHRQHDLNKVRMVLNIEEETERYVLARLIREGRHGAVTRVADNTFEYTIEVPDTLEMVPWLRTFIGRIVSIEGTEKKVIAQFKLDIENMLLQYDEGEADV